jgi:hypothetical protein
LRPNFVAVRLNETENRAQQPRNLGNVGLAAKACEAVRAASHAAVSTGSLPIPLKVDARPRHREGAEGVSCYATGQLLTGSDLPI